jgi:hypothetical protein
VIARIISVQLQLSSLKGSSGKAVTYVRTEQHLTLQLVLVRQVASAYNHGVKVYLDDYHDPNLSGHLIKKFLRDLPSPLIHEELLALVRVCPLGGDDCIRQ